MTFHSKPRSKYGNRKTSLDGKIFDSKAEANRWAELAMMERAGEIHDLRTQERFTLQEAFKDNQGQHHRAITYIVDFTYRDKAGRLHAEDVKGFMDQKYPIKRKLFQHRYPEILFKEIGKNSKGEDLQESLFPRTKRGKKNEL